MSKRKRGRPRKQNVQRTKSGHISRAKSAYVENVEPIMVRMRMYKLTEEQARDQKAETVHGIMHLRQKIGTAQFDAGQEMFALRRSYLKAIKAPDALSNGTGSGAKPDETAEYVEWSNRVRQRYANAQRAILDAQASHRNANLWAALDYMLFRNEYHEHLESDFAIVLRVLSVEFGLTENRKSDAVHEIPRSQRCA